MKKQKKTLNKEKNHQSLPDLKKEMNRTEQLETEKKELYFQIEEEKRTSHEVLGNL